MPQSIPKTKRLDSAGEQELREAVEAAEHFLEVIKLGVKPVYALYGVRRYYCMDTCTAEDLIQSADSLVATLFEQFNPPPGKLGANWSSARRGCLRMRACCREGLKQRRERVDGPLDDYNAIDEGLPPIVSHLKRLAGLPTEEQPAEHGQSGGLDAQPSGQAHNNININVSNVVQTNATAISNSEMSEGKAAGTGRNSDSVDDTELSVRDAAEPTTRASGSEQQPSQPTSGPVAPPGASFLAQAMQKLKPAERHAFNAHEIAVLKMRVTDPTDKQVYAWIEAHTEVLDDYTLPSCDTWARQVRAARRACGKQKNTPRSGRPHGNTIINHTDLQPPEGDPLS